MDLAAKPRIEEVTAALAAFTAEPQTRQLPMAPHPPIVVHAKQDRPQPRLDVHHGRGMTVHVGRVRPCPILGYKLVALGHNVVRGAAGAALLNAELIVARQRSGADVHADRQLESVPAVGEVQTQQA